MPNPLLIPGAIIGSSVISGLFGRSGAKAQAAAANQGTAAQMAMFGVQQANQAPWLEAGRNALGQLEDFQGGDLSGFYNSPTYKFGLEQGQRALNRMNAATGNSLSGRGIMDNVRLGGAVANQYRNNLASLAGVGQTAATNVGNAAMTTGQGVANTMHNAGNARASAYGSMNNAIQGGIQNYMLHNYLNPSTNNAMFMNNAAGTGSYNSFASPF